MTKIQFFNEKMWRSNYIKSKYITENFRKILYMSLTNKVNRLVLNLYNEKLQTFGHDLKFLEVKIKQLTA